MRTTKGKRKPMTAIRIAAERRQRRELRKKILAAIIRGEEIEAGWVSE